MSELGDAVRPSLVVLVAALMAGCFQWDWAPREVRTDGGVAIGMDAGPSDAGSSDEDAAMNDAGRDDAGASGDAGCIEDYCVGASMLYECDAMAITACPFGCMHGACVGLSSPDAGAGP